MKISLAASLAQALVAISAVSLLFALYHFSKRILDSILLKFEQVSALFIILLGTYWLIIAILSLRSIIKNRLVTVKNRSTFQIFHIQQKINHCSPLILPNSKSNLAKNNQDSAQCSCGHTHLPNQSALNKIEKGNLKSTLLIILSMGLRPCSGAVLVLFLSASLDLFPWGILSALTMGLGTGLTLSLFGLCVLFMRRSAIQLNQRYFTPKYAKEYALLFKIFIAISLILMGFLLFNETQNMLPIGLFKR